MIHQIYSIKDIKTGTFTNPFFSLHDESAKKIVAGLLKTEESWYAQYPADYELYNLGIFDDKGIFQHHAPEIMVSLLSLKETHINERPQFNQEALETARNQANKVQKAQGIHPIQPTATDPSNNGR